MYVLLAHNRYPYLALVVGEILRCPDILWLLVSGGFIVVYPASEQDSISPVLWASITISWSVNKPSAGIRWRFSIKNSSCPCEWELLSVIAKYATTHFSRNCCVFCTLILAVVLRLELRHRNIPITHSLANCCLTG